MSETHLSGRLTIYDLTEVPDFGALGGALGAVGGAVSDVAQRIAGAAGGTAEEILDVIAFSGEEAIDELYRFSLDVVADPELELEQRAIGREARLELHFGERSRVVHGIIAEAEALESIEAVDHEREVVRLDLVPRAHLMTLRRVSRVFQEKTAEAIIREVLLPYFIPVRFHLRERLPVRPYACQLGESDFEFVRRIAAEHGMFLCFEQPSHLAENVATGAMGMAQGLMTGGVSAAGALDALGALGGSLASGRAREVIVFADNAAAYTPVTFDGGEAVAEWLARTALGLVAGTVAHEVGGAVGNLAGQIGGAAAGSAVGGAATELLGEAFDALSEELGGTPSLRFTGPTGALTQSDLSVASLTRRQSLRATNATFSDYDPRRPHATFRHEAEAEPEDDPMAQALAGVGAVAGALIGSAELPDPLARATEHIAGHRPLEIYAHEGKYLHPEWDYDKEEAERMLRAARADRDLVRGATRCPWLSAGHTFELTDHPLGRLNRRYVVLRVRHRAPRATDEASFRYESSIACLPAETAFLGRYRRPHASTCITATVVGGGRVHTEAAGMIRVRFHWDRETRGGAEASTCWLRVMQPWAGAGWGMQFLPRVGTEVVVGFEAGDPDRPLVLGGVYNAANPWPFPLPESRTKSGIVTRSIPEGDMGNELSFEDASDRERIYLHATRDLEVLTRRDRMVTVRHDDVLDVTGEQRVRVHGASRTEVTGALDVSAVGGHSLSVQGQHQLSVTGDSNAQIDGARHVSVSGRDVTEVEGRRQVSVTGDCIERVGGNLVQLVGSADAPRTLATHAEGGVTLSASKTLELSAEESLVLRCGDSVLRLTPDQAELSSPTVIVRGEGVRALFAESSLTLLADDKVQVKANTVLLKASGAGLGLSSEASLDGSRVLLNSPQSADDSVSDETPEPTIIELVDESGEPIANHPFRIVLGDGREIGGTLDDRGRAEIFLEEGGDIFFPGLRDVQET